MVDVADVAGTIQEGGTLSENGSITFTDVDLTDRPTAAEATASVTSQGVTLTAAQQTAIENAFTLPSPSNNTNNGTVIGVASNTWESKGILNGCLLGSG